MAVKRSDCRTNKPRGTMRSAEESWVDEIKYQMTRIQEAAAVIRELSRRKSPSWDADQVAQLTGSIESEADAIRVAYQQPPAIETFQFETSRQNEVQKAS